MMQKVYFQSALQDRFPVEVVGESSYQDNIQNIIVYVGDDEKRFRDDSFTAELILEDGNPHDPGNAVRVDIDGQTVGYLNTANARKYRKALVKIGRPDAVGVCGALIAGRYSDYHNDKIFGVWLDLDLKNPVEEKPKPSVSVSPHVIPTIVEEKPKSSISVSPRVIPTITVPRSKGRPSKKFNIKWWIIVLTVVVLLCLLPLCIWIIQVVIRAVIEIIQSELSFL